MQDTISIPHIFGTYFAFKRVIGLAKVSYGVKAVLTSIS